MFNSPSSRLTPRRGTTRPGDSLALSAARPPVARGTPSLFSEPSVAQTPTARSRLAFSRLPLSPTSSAGETARTARGIDSFQRVTWSRDDQREIYALGQLPKEVQSVLKKADFVSNSVSGHVDIPSGLAFVTTADAVIAWNYQKRTHSSPTCYIFQAPASPSRRAVPVMASFFSSFSATEPGMVLVSPAGEMRFWENMSTALAMADRFQTMEVPLAEGDHVERLFRVDATTLVVTTAAALAFRVTITSSGGRLVPHISPLTRSGGFFSRSSTMIFPKNNRGEGITAVATSEGAVFLLSGRTLQKWVFAHDSQKFIREYDLHDFFGTEFWDDWSSTTASVEIRDLVPCGQNQIASLVSYSEGQSSPSHQSQSYAIHIFSVHPHHHTLHPDRIVEISHSATLDPRALDHPRLLIPANSPVAFVRFAAEVVQVTLADGREDVIALRDQDRNALIGTGCVTTPVSTRRSNGPALVLMPISGGLMGLEVLEQSHMSTTRDATSGTALIQSKMEQAVFFGDRSDNPLSFSLLPNTPGDVAAAAEAVSMAILSSASPYQPALFEIRPLLQDRLARLKELMSYIRSNDLLHKISQASRRALSRDVEKTKGALDLWDHQNKLMEYIGSDSAQSLLADSIKFFMQSRGRTADEDVLRTFFRTQTAHLESLLQLVLQRLMAAVSISQSGVGGTEWVLESNRIFLLSLRAALRYREEEYANYQIDEQSPPIEFWTANGKIMDALEHLYFVTESTILERTRTLGSFIDDASTQIRDPVVNRNRQAQNTLKTQLSHLAAVWFTNMEDKIRVQSREMHDGADLNEGIDLKRKWDEMRPRMIKPLVGFDKTTEAFELAEHHRDFATLVALCHDAQVGKDVSKVQVYIEKFGEDFAFVLYQWYIDSGNSHTLMTQDEVYGHLLTRFFEVNHYPQLAWMHHIASGRYGQAAAALASVGASSGQLSQKHLVSSIGKLAAVAEIKINGGLPQATHVLGQLDDEVEQVAIQNQLRAILSVKTGRGSSAKIAGENAANLDDRPTLQQHYLRLVKDLVAGHALGLEDLIDVLTLKENRGDSVDDGVTAITRLIHDSTLPEGRKQVALLSVWRRIFIRDDWHVVANTAGRSDETQRNMLRATLTYHTLKELTPDPNFPESFIVPPYDASTAPLPVEIAARFPDLRADEVDLLMRDHHKEIETLKEYIDHAGLERMLMECAELVKRDATTTGDGDVIM